MFTGIIESLGVLNEVHPDKRNKRFKIKASFAQELVIDQSVSHDGVCLTVEKVEPPFYQVTAIEETLDKSNIGEWEEGQFINLERSMQIGDRLDGHIVQGHVDCTASCTSVKEHEGSWVFEFQIEQNNGLIIDKGSITVNGTSLTVVKTTDDLFTVAIIPYTFNHTNFKSIEVGTKVNIEFDVIGKYVAKLLTKTIQ